MKAREAEKLIAAMLTGAEIKHEVGDVVDAESLIGFQRSRPIYERKRSFFAKNRRGPGRSWRHFMSRLWQLLSSRATMLK